MPDRAPDVRPAIIELTLSRFREFLREPEAVFWVFIFPLLLAGGLGIAFRSRAPERPKVLVLSHTPATTVQSALGADPRIELVSPTTSDDSIAARELRTGHVALVVAVGDDSLVEYRFDLSRPEARTARFLADDALQRGAGRRDPLASRDRTVSAPGSRYIDFVVPGLLGMNLMGSGIWGIGFAIVDARRKKLLKRLIATPMSRAQYLMSFLLQRLVLLVFEVTALLGFGILVFGVPMRGSWLTIATICLLGSLAFGGIGLLIAARPRTIEGASGLMNLVMLPMWVFSGVFFASSNFPQAAQPVIRALPLTAVIDALRATMLEGAGWSTIAPQLLVVTTWLVISFVLALRLFRWR